MNERTSSERLHIGFFGKRNAGKSSVVNAVTAQQLSVVSDVLGTTTDPVQKAMELLPIGPVVIIDTPGIDDEGSLGQLRVEQTRRVLGKTDLAVLVVDATSGLTDIDNEMIGLFTERKLPYIICYNKADLLATDSKAEANSNKNNSSSDTDKVNSIYVSALNGQNIHELKEMIGRLGQATEVIKPIVTDLVQPGDTVILVIPIDSSAPKNRIILPQQQVLSELLTYHCKVICCQPQELADAIKNCTEHISLVITDSQAFERVNKDTPADIRLTSFSILFARYKGSLPGLVAGAKALKNLSDGDKVLISEGCTHHRQCEDIGTVKMPGWIEEYSHVKPDFSFTSGGTFPEDTSEYKVIVHCGGCMLNEAEMKNRMRLARESGTPIVNYGVAIAAMHGILDRSLAIFGM